MASDRSSSAGKSSRDAPPEVRSRASLPLLVLAWLAVVAALYFARDVLVPVVLALFLALLLRPILRRMRGLHLPDVVSSFVLIVSMFVVFIAALLTLAGQAEGWLSQAPKTIERVRQLLPAEAGPLQKIEETTTAVEKMSGSNAIEQALAVRIRSQDVAYRMLGASGRFVGAAVIVFVVGFFLLAFSDALLKQAIAVPNSFGDKRNVVHVLQEVEVGVSRYLTTITVINIGLGTASGIALWLLGMPNPVLWGVMAMIANYVPHLGAFVCAAILFCVGAVTHESLAYGLLVAGVFSALTSAESYLITPLVLSRSLQLSPLAVILSILFWGWLWGIAGGLMAAPILAVVKIACDQFPSCRHISMLLSGDTPSANHQGENGRASAARAA
jgi:predicted PurR-regulated permease PerM